MLTVKPRFSWTQPICNNCWDERYPDRPPVGLLPEHREKETCVYCNQITTSGIYIRIDPNEAPHPTMIKT